jgi:hypothetical protein
VIYTLAKEHCFIPAWNGNRDLPEKEQIKVYINHPSAIEAAEKYAAVGAENIQLFEFCLYVKRFENFQLDDGGKVKDATPEIVMKTEGLTDLVNEIREEYGRMMVDKKK